MYTRDKSSRLTTRFMRIPLARGVTAPRTQHTRASAQAAAAASSSSSHGDTHTHTCTHTHTHTCARSESVLNQAAAAFLLAGTWPAKANKTKKKQQKALKKPLKKLTKSSVKQMKKPHIKPRIKATIHNQPTIAKELRRYQEPSPSFNSPRLRI